MTSLNNDNSKGAIMPGLKIPGIEDSMFTPKSTGLDKAMGFMNRSQGTFSRTQPNIPLPDKSIGGGLSTGMAGAGAGAAIGSALAGATVGSVLPGWGTAIGAAVGLAGYYLS